MSAHDNRPEVQARKIADMGNPECQRRKALYRSKRGRMKKVVADWNAAWNIAGRPKTFPDFPVWFESQRVKYEKRWAEEQAFQERINLIHADWISRGMPA